MKKYICLLALFLFSANVNAAILVFSQNGTYTTKPTLSTAVTSADTAGKTIVVTSALSAVQSNISSATVHQWPSDRALKVDKSGSVNPTTKFTGLTNPDPKWFGAKSDGITDDTVAVQKAIDSIVTVGTIILDNNYLSNSAALQIPAGKTITFKTLRPIVCNTVDGNDSGVSTNARTFQNAGYIIFDHVIANNTNVKGGVFCDTLGGVASKVTAIGCTITGFSTGFGTCADGSAFIGNTITLRQVDAGHSLVYTFYGIHSEANNLRIIGNHIKYGRHHVYGSGGSARSATGWIVDGNKFEGSWWQSVHFYASNASYPTNSNVISNNILSACGTEPGNVRASIIISSYFNNILISNNNIQSPYGYGIKLEGTAAATAYGVTITGNKIYGQMSGCPGGIDVYNSNSNTVSNNDISIIGWPIVIESNGSNNKVQGNTIDFLTGTLGITQFFSVSNVDFSNNVCRNMNTSLWNSGSYITNGLYLDTITGTSTGNGNVVNGYVVTLDNAVTYKHGLLADGAAVPNIYHHAGDSYKIVNPVEAGATPNKYIITGKICTSSGDPAAFVDTRSLTGN